MRAVGYHAFGVSQVDCSWSWRPSGLERRRPASTAKSKDEQLFVGGMDLKTVLFGSLDAGRSTFLTVGAKQTFTGPLDRSGLVSLVTVGYGGSPGQAGSEKDS